MSRRQSNSAGSQRTGPGEEDYYGLSEPGRQSSPPDPTARYVQAAREPMVSAADPLPPPPRWPMVSGVFTFPWHLQTLACWMVISIGLIVLGYLLGMLLGPGSRLGIMGPRVLGLPIAVAKVLTLSYASVCCLKVIEETSYGWDSIDLSTDLDWKGWAYYYAYLCFQVFQAALLGMGVKLITFSASWTPMICVTFATLPIILLSSLAANSAWLPWSLLTVLRSLRPLWRQWLLFYVETGSLIMVWVTLTASGLRASPWLVPLHSGPLLAAVMLIYARLVGRLAWHIAAQSR